MSTKQQESPLLPFPAPPSLHSSFAMLPASLPGDLEQMTAIYYAAFASDPGNCFWWAPTREQQETWLKARITKKFSDPAVRHYKIVHVETGDIAAWARWDIPEGAVGFGEGAKKADVKVDVSAQINNAERESVGGTSGGSGQALTASETPSTGAAAAAAGTTTSSEGKEQKKGLTPPEGANAAWCEAFFSALLVMHEKWDAGKMLGLSLIATSPSYQRRGAARALIEPLLALADSQGLQTYLEATAAGRPVYEKLGFREVDVLEYNVREITGGAVDIERVTLSVMVREPSAGKAEEVKA
ncbi:acyl-CoA N-acyltransferase [Microdochium bolleyi]|uniref:Acyl-CoA N-acyltransferase n=1 Tax=Microdochium bolleyi TaxID=196109 RepID=A0A136J1F5_9PEZI|nr:acyl-CoA N-acyltransferase [Microdochium bolleyi]